MKVSEPEFDDTSYIAWYERLSTSPLSRDVFAKMPQKKRDALALGLADFNAFSPNGSRAWKIRIRPSNETL